MLALDVDMSELEHSPPPPRCTRSSPMMQPVVVAPIDVRGAAGGALPVPALNPFQPFSAPEHEFETSGLVGFGRKQAPSAIAREKVKFLVGNCKEARSKNINNCDETFFFSRSSSIAIGYVLLRNESIIVHYSLIIARNNLNSLTEGENSFQSDAIQTSFAVLA